jgi:hypothetical protein
MMRALTTSKRPTGKIRAFRTENTRRAVPFLLKAVKSLADKFVLF